MTQHSTDTESSPNDVQNKEEPPVSQEAKKKEPEKEKKAPPPPTNEVKKLLESFEDLKDTAKNVRLILDFMDKSLEKKNSISLRDFWSARHQAGELLKEKGFSGEERDELWKLYIDSTQKARRVKEILDEQSDFAVEQIEIAIKAVEDEIKTLDNQLEKAPVPKVPQIESLQKPESELLQLQKELNLLNVYANRIHSLRKELTKTDMRVRFKNQFFKRLSELGDKVFPRRKELVSSVSEHFRSAAEGFADRCLSKSKNKEPLFKLRGEIKDLQAAAKVFTLNTATFNDVRKKLGKCWDFVRDQEKELRKERSDQDEVSKKNAEQFEEKWKKFEEGPGKTSGDEAVKALDELFDFLKKQTFSKDDVRTFRSRLFDVKKKWDDEANKEQAKRREVLEKKEKALRESFEQLRKQFEETISASKGKCSADLMTIHGELIKELNGSDFSENDLEELNLYLYELMDQIIQTKVQETLNALPSEGTEAKKQLSHLLDEVEHRRDEVKQLLERFKKTSSSSGLDFEQALQRGARVNAEKDRLMALELSIEDLEDRIEALENP